MTSRFPARRSLLATSLALAAGALLPLAALAQAFPAKPITFVVPFAAFIAAVDVVPLAEPASPGGVLVEVTRADDGEVLLLEEIGADENCEVVTGFRLEGDDVLLCGEGRPGPGDSIRILARGEEDVACGAPKLEVSGGGANCASSGALPLGAAVASLLALAVRRRRLEGRRAGDPAMLISDNSAILATLDWTPRHADLDGIVRDALAWERTLAERQR